MQAGCLRSQAAGCLRSQAAGCLRQAVLPGALPAIRQEIARRGWDRKATGRILLELLFHLTLAITGTVVFVTADAWWARACGLIGLVAGSMGVGTNTHTSSHYGTSEKRWVNEWLTYFGYPFFLGLSATFWWRQHVTVHHHAPNVIGIDDDADLWPWFAMTQSEVERSRGWRRWYYQNAQWLVFPLALAANGFNFVRTGWRHVIRMLRNRGERKRAHWIDLGALALHNVIYLGVPMIFFTPGDVTGFYLLRTALLGYGMFAMQAPGHFPAEAARLAIDQRRADFVLLQTANTVNFDSGWIGRLFSSGLGFQIEHHLFPNLSHVHYRRLSPLVREMCRRNGYPYHSFGWDHVVWKCWMVFRKPRPVVTDAETLRRAV
ncbi:MAG: fatty acid desaturase [Acidobacteriota bacterium]|nr:MAG: fatty acid desaturase [Acidobacteriota bacterium]